MKYLKLMAMMVVVFAASYAATRAGHAWMLPVFLLIVFAWFTYPFYMFAFSRDMTRTAAFVAARRAEPYLGFVHHFTVTRDLVAARDHAERLKGDARLVALASIDVEEGDLASVTSRSREMRTRSVAAYLDALVALDAGEWANFERHRTSVPRALQAVLDAERLFAEGRVAEAEAEADRIVAATSGVRRFLLSSELSRSRAEPNRRWLF